MKKVIGSLIILATAAGCGKKKEEESTTNSDGSTKLSSLSDPSQLGLSTALKVSLPKSYEGGSTALTEFGLLNGKKSMEACRIGQTIKEVIQRLDQVSSFACHIEVEKAKIAFGKKYKVTSKGQEFGRIWIDNSKAADGQMAFYMCRDGKLEQSINITGIKMGADGKPSAIKGSLADQGSSGTQTWKSSIDFDQGFIGKYKEISGKDRFSDTSNGGDFARQTYLKLMDESSDLSLVSVASKGTWGGSAFSQKAYGKSKSGLGQVYATDAGTNNGSTFSYTKRSYFDISTGLTKALSDSSLFAETGDLYVKSSEVPEYLSATFSPDAPSGWDCNAVDETVDLDPDTAEHKACEKSQGSRVDCWGSDFEQGS